MPEEDFPAEFPPAEDMVEVEDDVGEVSDADEVPETDSPSSSSDSVSISLKMWIEGKNFIQSLSTWLAEYRYSSMGQVTLLITIKEELPLIVC